MKITAKQTKNSKETFDLNLHHLKFEHVQALTNVLRTFKHDHPSEYKPLDELLMGINNAIEQSGSKELMELLK